MTETFWTMIAAIAAVISVGVLIWQTRKTLQNQTLLQLMTFWGTAPMYPRIRMCAAKDIFFYLQAQRENESRKANGRSDLVVQKFPEDTPEIDDVIDFFETIAFLTQSSNLTFKQTYHAFYSPMINYWCVAKEYILNVQKDEEMSVWRDFTKLMPKLIKYSDYAPNSEQIYQFFYDEYTRTRE